MLQQLLSEAKQLGSDIVWCSGNFTDPPKHAHAFLREVVDLVNSLSVTPLTPPGQDIDLRAYEREDMTIIDVAQALTDLMRKDAHLGVFASVFRGKFLVPFLEDTGTGLFYHCNTLVVRDGDANEKGSPSFSSTKRLRPHHVS